MAKGELTKQPRKPTMRRLAFMTKVEGATEVVLTGDFTGWAKDKIQLNPMGDGEWNTMLELPPGDYRYRLIVDGEWQDHPEATKRVPNSFGTMDSVLTVS